MEQMRKVVDCEYGVNSSISQVFNPGTIAYQKIYENSLKNEKQSSKINALGKVRVACFLLTLALLSFLFIYNFVAMNNLRVSIANMQSSIESEQAYIDDLKVKINNLSQEQSIYNRVVESGYSQDVPVNDNIRMVNVKKNETTENLAQTNWFNDLCNYFSSIFGG